jgi:23S rRNA (cytosine1962-C5)-methyltransferase
VRRELVLDALEAAFRPRAILERTSEKAARADRFEARSGLVRGALPDALRFSERSLRYDLPLSLAQKTGFYFDQRPLRARIEELASGKSVLDLYSYVGALGLNAARGGASRVLSVDSSAPALEIGKALAERNGLAVAFEKHDALAFLNQTQPEWDIVISDPPKLAQSRAGRDKAVGAFRRIAAASVAATRPGGLCVLSSCSAALGLREVERCLALGARDVGREATVLERLFQGPDHPVPPAFPEGLYLTTTIAEVR